MLSPASLRVCCLAVMAPALWKADRRADCLPVVFPEPFKILKTAGTLNSEDNTNKITFSRLSYKTAWQPSYRKSHMHKTCLRTSDRTKHGFPIKTKYSAVDVRKSSAFNNGVCTNASSKNKPWQYTNIAAFAGKIRLKYTMSKNNFANKNMGLAKANTSLGLQDLKKMKKISRSHLSEEDMSILESDGESSPDVIDKTNSDFQNRTSLTVVSSISEDILKKNHLSEHDCDLFLPSSSLDGLPSDALNEVVSFRDASESRPKECLMLNHSVRELSSEVRLSTSESNDPTTRTDPITIVNSMTVGDKNESSIPFNNSSHSSLCLEKFKSNESTSEVSVSPQTINESINEEFIENLVSELPLDSTLSIKKQSPEVCNFSNNISLLTFENSNEKFHELPIFSSLISDIGNICLPLITTHLMDIVSWEESTVCKAKNVQKLSSQICCSLTNEDHKSISQLISDKEKKLTTGIYNYQFLQCKQMNAHVKTQIQKFIGHYQKKLACQMQEDPSSSKPKEDVVDSQAEHLESEDLKSISTAALVNLVHKLESSTSSDKLMYQPKNNLLMAEVSPEKVGVVFDSEEFADVKRTSSVLLNKMKNLLKAVDQDLTDESTDEESSNELPIQKASYIHSSNLKKCLMERASLHSRSSWLITRTQELEYQRRIYEEKLKETKNLDGDVCFAESVASDITLCNIDIDNINEHISTKQTSLKSLIRPVNGYLDHSSVNDSTYVNHPLCASTVRPNIPSIPAEECCRTRPLKTTSFHNRKLIYTQPFLKSKVSKFSTVSCCCNSLNVMEPCVLCAGRYNSVQSVDPDSMTLQDRIALLDPIFHPVLSLDKEIPMGLHIENILKLSEAQYQTLQPMSPINQRKMRFGAKPKHFSELRYHRKLNHYARSLSVKYRNKHVQNSKHLRKHRLYFGKWRRINKTKHSFHSRDNTRRFSIVSTASSHDSPVPSPMSVFDDGSVLDYIKKRRDEDQFDINDVILPFNSKIGRAAIEYENEEITCPSWRCEDRQGPHELEDLEKLSDAVFVSRHDRSEIEERKHARKKTFGLNKRARRMLRCDSRADSSGANTPDPVLLYNQEIMFQMPNSLGTGPSSPALSPPTTPSSTAVISDDSQPPFGNGTSGFERRKCSGPKRFHEDSTGYRGAINEIEVQPYSNRVYPLGDEEYEMACLASTHNVDYADSHPSEPSCPASPNSFCSSTSTVEEEEDITDPEWTVVKRESGPSQALVLKFAKR